VAHRERQRRRREGDDDAAREDALSTQAFSDRFATESEPLGCDFAARLDTGETITGGTVTCAVLRGTDADAATRVTGSVTVAGGIVRRRFVGGIVGVTYLLTFTATTSDGDTLVEKVTVTVV
jgi:hypothetical protein